MSTARDPNPAGPVAAAHHHTPGNDPAERRPELAVLTLHLAGPLQAWGSASRFVRRTTESAPTKSGVVGLFAAALGRARDADLTDLVALRLGVRIEQPGSRIRDFQTAHQGDTDKAMPLSERYYLADAAFLVGVEGPVDLIQALDGALRAPAFLPYLGRRSCPPGRPLDPEVHGGRLEEVLTAEPWRASRWYQRRRRAESHVPLTLLIEASPADAVSDTLRDQPLSFDPRHRRYGLRGVRSPAPVHVRNPEAHDHDPTLLLDGA